MSEELPGRVSAGSLLKRPERRQARGSAEAAPPRTGTETEGIKVECSLHLGHRFSIIVLKIQKISNTLKFDLEETKSLNN